MSLGVSRALGRACPWCRQLIPEPCPGLCPQLRAVPTYQVMLSTAHELPEGSLIFLTERQELYVRLRGGFRRVLVSGVGWRAPGWGCTAQPEGSADSPAPGLGGDSWRCSGSSRPCARKMRGGQLGSDVPCPCSWRSTT